MKNVCRLLIGMVLVISMLVIPAKPVQATADWYNSSWGYRKQFSINGSTAGAQTDYQMMLTVHKGTGSDSGADVYLGSNVQDDFDDIRFTKSDGTTLLDYWIESYTSGTSAVVWVEFDSIPASPSTANFYIYYGNSGASSGSNGNNTFPFFDDFNDGSIDTNKWFHWIDNGSESESGGVFAITGHADYNAWGAKTKFGVNYAYRGRCYTSAESGNDVDLFVVDERSANGQASGATDMAGFRIVHSSAKKYATANDSGGITVDRDDAITSYAVLEIQRNSNTNCKFLINDTDKYTITTNYLPEANCGFMFYADSAITLYYDWVLVRKKVTPEPTWGTWGSEEVPDIKPTVTTQAVSGIGYTGGNFIATLNGNITNTGSSTPNYRGFVWSTSTHDDPGDTAPASSAYSDNWTESGSFSTGSFSHQETSFSKNTTYYVRAFAHNSEGWAYGNEVSFTTLNDPTCTTDDASQITYSTARLNAIVTSDGGQLADVRFAYDTVTRANFDNYAHITDWVNDTYQTGDHPYVDLTDLNFGQVYYFRVQVRNDVSTATGDEKSFLTLNSVMQPTNVTTIPYSTSISMSWIKGSGAQMTAVRYKLGTYPTATNDGILAGLTTGGSISVTGLTPGRTYYFSLWGYTGGKYSNDYATAVGTTTAFNPVTSTTNNIETPTASSTWTQTPSSAKLSTVPFHEIVEDISSSYKTPLNMVWYVIWMVIGLAGGILLYNRVGQGGQSSYNLPMVLVLEGIWFSIGSVIGLTMMWIVVFLAITSAGFIMFGQRR